MSEQTRTPSIAGWLGQVVAWFVIAAVAGMLAICVVIPRLGGATPYTILTGSMRPDLPPGTLVVVKPVHANEISLGNVITYQLKSGESTTVTHRVVSVKYDEDGSPVFKTQGDANNAPDPKQVIPAQVKGKLWYAVPHLGRASNLIDNAQRHAISVVLIGGLLAYAAYMFISSARERRTTRDKKKEEVSA